MENKKSYYAIIPASIRYNQNLPANAKLLYGELTALCNEKGYCWANNRYFAELYNVSIPTISSWISKLLAEGFIRVEISAEGGNARHIFIEGGGLQKNPRGGLKENLKRSSKKPEEGLKENLKHNNKENNKKNTTHTEECEKKEIKYENDDNVDLYALAAQVTKKGGKVWLGSEHKQYETPKPHKKLLPEWKRKLKWRDKLIDWIEDKYDQPLGYRPTQYSALKEVRVLVDADLGRESTEQEALKIIKEKYKKALKVDWLDGVIDFKTLLYNWHKLKKTKRKHFDLTGGQMVEVEF